MSDDEMYDVAETAHILRQALGEAKVPNLEVVSILAKEGKLEGTRNPTSGAWMFSNESLNLYITNESIKRFGVKRLSKERQSHYAKQKQLTWWEALYIFHGIEPSESSPQTAGLLFPDVYWKLHKAIELGTIGVKRKSDSFNTETDTFRNWQVWFDEPLHTEQRWHFDLLDTTPFENLLLQVSAADSAKSAEKTAEYNRMAQALYRAKVENPGESIAICAGMAAIVLEAQNLSVTPESIIRRTGRINQSLLKSLQNAARG